MGVNLDRPAGGFTTPEWDAAVDWDAYLASVVDKKEIWDANWRRARVEDAAVERLQALPGPRRVLVLTEDWCGDAARSVPVLARAFAAARDVEHRYLASDLHPHVIERYLTHGGRGIPIVIVQDERGLELGAWGPRPASLQAFFRAHRRAHGAPTEATKSEFYAPVMAWYGKDQGVSVVNEILMLLERGGAPR